MTKPCILVKIVILVNFKGSIEGISNTFEFKKYEIISSLVLVFPNDCCPFWIKMSCLLPYDWNKIFIFYVQISGSREPSFAIYGKKYLKTPIIESPNNDNISALQKCTTLSIFLLIDFFRRIYNCKLIYIDIATKWFFFLHNLL